MQYPLIELVIGVGFVVIYSLFYGTDVGMSLPCLGAILLFYSVVGIFVADIKTECIPLGFIISGFIATLLLLSPLLWVCVSGSSEACASLLYEYAIPSVFGAGFFFFLWFFSKGRAMGDGDIFLAGIIGLTLGYPKLIIAYYAAFLTGAVVGVILILVHKKGMKSHIPFGPFMIFGLGIAYMYGPPILNWWSHLW